MMRITHFLYALAIGLLFTSCWFRSKPQADASQTDAAIVEDVSAITIEDVPPPPPQKERQYLYSSIYRINELFEGAEPFIPTQEEVLTMKTPSSGSYSILNRDVDFDANANAKLIAYVNKDSSDIRVLWVNRHANNAIHYSKYISQLKGKRPFTFSFDSETKMLIVKPEYYRTGTQYFVLRDDGSFQLLSIPIVYAVSQSGVIVNSLLKEGTEVTLIDMRYQSDNKSNCCTQSKVNAPDVKEFCNSFEFTPSISPVYAVEGAKVYKSLPLLREVEYVEDKYGKHREKMVASMQDDATATHISAQTSVYEIEHRGTLYTLFMIESSFRYGSYNWFWAMTSRDENLLHSLSSIAGSFGGADAIKVFTLNDNLFFHLDATWQDADGNDCSGFYLNYLSPKFCEEALWHMN